MGWFHRFKLHIIINGKGEILKFTIIQANVGYRRPLKNKYFLDKIYVVKDLIQFLFANGLHLITHIKNNIKNSLMTMIDEILLRKGS